MTLPMELGKYLEHLHEAELLHERIEQLEAEAQTPRAAVLDGMPKGPRSEVDKIGAAVGRLEALRERERALTEKVRAEYSALDTAIDSVIVGRKPEINARTRQVLRLRYLDGMNWKSVNDALWLNEADFIEKEDSYLRRTHKLNQNGLLALSKILQEGIQ